MVDPRLITTNPYPVDITAPDISAYKKGYDGRGQQAVDYIHTFTTQKAGPHVMISAVVHGNELCGANVVDWLLTNDIRPLSGTLSLGFMNVDAFLSYDPSHPDLSRWVDEDFNRIWSPGTMDDPDRPQTSEICRGKAVRHVIAEVDLLLDIHSMHKPCDPLMMAGLCAKGRQLAQSVDMGMRTVTDQGHKEGMRMRDFGAFSDPERSQNALLVECGQHWDKRTQDVAFETMVRFLRCTGIMEEEFGAEWLENPLVGPKDFLDVQDIITVETEHFTFAKDWQGLEELQKGQLIGTDQGTIYKAPFDPTVLIMPDKRLIPGKTAVRLAQKL